MNKKEESRYIITEIEKHIKKYKQENYILQDKIMEMQKTICSLHKEISDLREQVAEFQRIHNLSDHDMRMLITRSENLHRITQKLEEGPPSLEIF